MGRGKRHAGWGCQPNFSVYHTIAGRHLHDRLHPAIMRDNHPGARRTTLPNIFLDHIPIAMLEYLRYYVGIYEISTLTNILMGIKGEIADRYGIQL